jgi:hypothetical protein
VTHADIQRDAAGLAALPPEHPERRAAEAHAADCVTCREALTRGAALQSLLQGMPAPEPPPPAVLARVAAEIQRDAVRARASIGRTAAAAIALAAVLIVVFAQHPAGGAWVWTGSLVVAAIAVAVALAVAQRLLALGVAAAVSLMFAALAGAGAGAGGGDGMSGGLHCFLSEVVAGALALGAAWFAGRRAGEPLGPAHLAAVAAAGGLGGQAALNIACPSRDVLLHLFAFHSGGVLCAAALGALVGAALARPAAIVAARR